MGSLWRTWVAIDGYEDSTITGMTRRFVDPFSPNRPVDDPDRFAGRRDQVDEVVDALYQLHNGNPRHCIITGDRGIGKSSLLLQARLLSQGDNRLAERLGLELGVSEFQFGTAWHDADRGQKLRDVVAGLARETESWLKTLLGRLNFKLSIFHTLEISRKETDDATVADLAHSFADDCTQAGERLRAEGYRGLIFFIDELDRVDPESGVASFFKLATERLARDGIEDVAFFAAGITGAIQKLEEDHASIVRVFRDIPIPRWTLQEADELLRGGFEEVGVSYEPQIVEHGHKLSGGFPEPLHLIGSEILSVDEDGHLTLEDLEEAKKTIVTDVRRNKLESLLRSAGSGKYQQILKAMAEYGGPNVPLKHISTHLNQEQSQYSANMGTLIERGILTKPDVGVYSFADPLLKEYIREFGIISVDVQEAS